jgi:hypothetical protein
VRGERPQARGELEARGAVVNAGAGRSNLSNMILVDGKRGGVAAMEMIGERAVCRATADRREGTGGTVEHQGREFGARVQCGDDRKGEGESGWRERGGDQRGRRGRRTMSVS